MRKSFLSRIALGVIVIILTILIQPLASAAQVVTAGTKTVPVYRFYWDLPQVHLYKTDPATNGLYNQSEGIAYYVSPVRLPYTVPLYYVGRAKNSDSFYTIDLAVKNHCVNDLGYGDGGVLGYVLPQTTDIPGTEPLHRWVRVHSLQGNTVQDHFYQTSASPVANYNFEGIECRVWTEPVKLPYRLIQLSAPILGVTLLVNETPKIGWRVWSGGGFIKLSYSKNSGSSWQAIATVANTGNFGDMNDQSYNGWKVPADAVGKILIKADWVKESDGSELPWATDTSGPRIVLPANFRVIRRP